MEKRKRSVSLSFVLLRFACIMLGLMLFCALLWLAIMQLLQTTGFIYHGSLPNRQAEAMLLDQSFGNKYRFKRSRSPFRFFNKRLG